MNEQSFSDWVVWLQEEPEDLESSSSFLVLIHILRLTWGPFPLMSLRKKWVSLISLSLSLILFVVVASSYFVYRMSSLMSTERHGHPLLVSLSCLDVVRMSLLQHTTSHTVSFMCPSSSSFFLSTASTTSGIFFSSLSSPSISLMLLLSHHFMSLVNDV